MLRSNAVRKELTEVVAEFNKRFRTGQALCREGAGWDQGGKQAFCCFSIQLLQSGWHCSTPLPRISHSTLDSEAMDSCQCTLTLHNPCMPAPPLLLPAAVPAPAEEGADDVSDSGDEEEQGKAKGKAAAAPGGKGAATKAQASSVSPALDGGDETDDDGSG